MIGIGIAGATGYTGYELIRLLERHPQTELVWLTSEQSAGKPYRDVYPGPWDTELIPLATALERADEVDVVFLALPHAQSVEPVRAFHHTGVTVIDLSADYRLRDPAAYAQWYGLAHDAPDLLDLAVYGLCEVYRSDIAGARLIANPGCYPTSVNLALYPLAKAGWLQPRIIVDSKSGVSGAGRKPKLSYHFVEANENISPYNVGYRHRHIAEMEQVLGQANATRNGYAFTFVPHLAPFNQGILSTIYASVTAGVREADIRALFTETYADEFFIQLLPAGVQASVRHVAHTNHCAISITPVNPHRTDGVDYVIAASIDNLVKGASGQAIQNMNIALGYEETTGLL